MVRRPSGTGASFVPRDALKNHYSFGDLAEWLPPAEGADDRHVDAAQLQHFLMWRLSQHALKERLSTAEIARSLGMSGDKLYRLKRGETLLPLADMLAFARLMPTIREAVCWYFTQDDTVVPGAGLPHFNPDARTV